MNKEKRADKVLSFLAAASWPDLQLFLDRRVYNYMVDKGMIATKPWAGKARPSQGSIGATKVISVLSLAQAIVTLQTEDCFARAVWGLGGYSARLLDINDTCVVISQSTRPYAKEDSPDEPLDTVF